MSVIKSIGLCLVMFVVIVLMGTVVLDALIYEAYGDCKGLMLLDKVRDLDCSGGL